MSFFYCSLMQSLSHCQAVLCLRCICVIHAPVLRPHGLPRTVSHQSGRLVQREVLPGLPTTKLPSYGEHCRTTDIQDSHCSSNRYLYPHLCIYIIYMTRRLGGCRTGLTRSLMEEFSIAFLHVIHGTRPP